LEILTENGMDGMAHALEIVFNAAMRIEPAEFLGAEPLYCGRAGGPRTMQRPRETTGRKGSVEW